MLVPARRTSVAFITLAAVASLGLGVAPAASADEGVDYIAGRVDVCKTNGYHAVAGWTGGRNGHPVNTPRYQWDNRRGYTPFGKTYREGDCLHITDQRKTGQGVFWRVIKSYGDDGFNDGYAYGEQFVRGGTFQWVDAW